MKQNKLSPWEKIFPNQPFNSDLYNRTDITFEHAAYETIMAISDLLPLQEEFEIEQTDMFTVEEMASSPVTMGLVRFLLGLGKAKTVLEIGAFIGISAMYMARALPDDGKVVSIEKFDHFADIARRNFERNGLGDKIELICADAADVLPDLARERRFDFVFIDGNKECYADYLLAVKDSVNDGGVIVIDDAFYHGDAMNKIFESEKGKGVNKSLVESMKFAGWQKIIVPISNGMLFLHKSVS